jgi:ABC-type multidrug transport system fused ATPase/permease subunit
MGFFEVNPLGRILNRFSNDIDQVDNVLPQASRHPGARAPCCAQSVFSRRRHSRKGAERVTPAHILPQAALGCFEIFFMALGAVAMCSVALPLIMLVLLPLGYIFWHV